jgi:hypothetical protein
MRLTYKLLLIITIIVGFSYHVINSKQISAEILQFKLNRIYLNVGVEELIYSGYNFWIINNTDTVLSGNIEFVNEGISISYPIDIGSIDFEFDKYDVVIETAEIDKSNPIFISFPELSDKEFTFISSTNISEKSRLKTIYDIDLNIRSNEIRLSYTNNILSNYNIIAPYISTLIPNLSKEINREGILTTSIYYIYNHDRLFSLSQKEAIEADCFWVNSECNRAYNRSPEKGKELLKRLKDKPSKIKISYLSESLKEQAEYIADILAQERIQVEITKNNMTADLFLMYIPLDPTRPNKSFIFIQEFLNGFDILSSSHEETISILNSYIDKLNNLDSTLNEDYFYNIIDNGLKYDLSVFPLFQPTIYIHYGDEVIYIKPESELKFNFNNFQKIKQTINKAEVHE